MQIVPDLPAYQDIKATLQRRRPDLYSALNPRLYRGADKWEATSVPAVHLGGNLEAFLDPEIPAEHAGDNLYCCMISVTATKLMQFGVPTFFVEEGLLDAVAQTEPPENACWTDIHLPFPAGILMLPKGRVRDSDGRAFNFVTWCRLNHDEKIHIHGTATPLKMANTSLVFSAASIDDPTFSGYTKTLDATTWPSARISGMTDSVERVTNLFDESERDVVNKLASLALGLLMVAEAAPKLMSEGSRIKTVRQAGVSREVWTPKVLGRGYETKREVGHSLSGSHASPRLHWRAGHLKRQVCGVGRTERKTIWIEPVLVNGERKGEK